MLTSILETFRRHKVTAEETYASLVLTIASGKPWPKSAVDTAVAAGRSVDDLQQDVTAELARREAEEQLTAADGMQQEIDRLAAELHEALAGHNELVTRHRRELESSHSRVSHADSDYQRAIHQRQNVRYRAKAVLG
ncbi:MAG: hypothetical protein Q8K78_07100 [Planctomycetaceae bacterium]|nr:hypothetical protein [Planctomycetaceae bacterium]